MSSGRMAVCVPVLGAATETFIRRHVEDLAPERTVVVSRRRAPAGSATWTTGHPTLFLDDLADEWGGAREQAALVEFLEAHGVRAVLTEYLDVWLPFLDLFRERRITCVAHGHGYDVSLRLREAYWRSEYLRYADAAAIVVPSEHNRGRLVRLGLSAARVFAVPCAVDVPEAVQRPVRERIEVVAVGRLVAKKNPVATVHACARAAAAGTSLRLTLIGDGPLLAHVRAAVSETGTDVRLLGEQPHAAVLEAMRAADIFCQHSVVDPVTGDEEGLPVAILEAMAHALPVVATRHAGIPEAVTDGGTGYLVEEGDIDAMAARIVTLATHPVLRHRMAAAGRARVESEFSWERERAALLGLLGPA